MKSIFLIFVVLACVSAIQAKESIFYSGSDSTEAVMTFQHFVEIDSSTVPSSKKAGEKIESQLNHLFGPMGEAEFKAVPRGNHKISNISITKVSGSKYKASYDYAGTIVLQNGPTAEFQIVLPNNPDTIYASAMSGSKNPCTDPHYQSEGDFWYFWNPAKPGCKLRENEDYQKIEAKIQRITNTVQTYPEYDRLVDDGKIEFTVLMGMDNPKLGRDPNKSKDINADNFVEIKNKLNSWGYTGRKWTKKEIKTFTGKTFKKTPYVEEFSKKIGSLNIFVTVFFGPSGIDEDSTAFHHFFKSGLEKSSVTIYDGHSGLGGHLDLGSIESTEGFTIAPKQNRYQIYFFNSCSSYTYYNTMFFDRKITSSDPHGTKNLDILTNGLSTYFNVMHDTNMALIQAVDEWASGKSRLSYQAIAKEIDSGNLFGINGDEDNPTN